MGGLWVTLKRRVPTLQPGARFHSYSVVKLRWPRATHAHENGWPPAAVRQLGYAPVYAIQFSKISETLPPTPYDENGQLPYCNSNSIHEAKSETQLPFAIPSYNGGSRRRVAIYRYVFGNIVVSYFCKCVIWERA